MSVVIPPNPIDLSRCSAQLFSATPQDRQIGGGNARFLGSGFAYRSSALIVTAAHTCDGHPTGMLALRVVRDELRAVRQVHRHPVADLAVLITSRHKAAFWVDNLEPAPPLGSALHIPGYVDPEDDPRSGSNPQPAFRVLGCRVEGLISGQPARVVLSKTPSKGLSGAPGIASGHDQRWLSATCGIVLGGWEGIRGEMLVLEPFRDWLESWLVEECLDLDRDVALQEAIVASPTASEAERASATLSLERMNADLKDRGGFSGM